MALPKPVNEVADKLVRIVVNNVWTNTCKLFNEDIVILPASIADGLIERKQAKLTKDDATVEMDVNGKRVEI